MESSSSKTFLVTVFILLAFTFNTDSTSAARAITKNSSTEFIRKSCGETTYPQLCFTSLSRHARAIQTSPKLLAETALSLTASTVQSTSTMMLKLSQTHGMKHREAAAISDCVEQMSDSVDELRNSLSEMSQLSGYKFQLIMNDIQTWVSAALTNEDTCMDGFDGKAMNGHTKNIVRGRILNIVHMTSNALALINKYASNHV